MKWFNNPRTISGLVYVFKLLEELVIFAVDLLHILCIAASVGMMNHCRPVHEGQRFPPLYPCIKEGRLSNRPDKAQIH